MESQHKPLTLNTLQEVDRGKVSAHFNHLIRLATDDIKERPLDKTARKIHLVVEMKPEVTDQGLLDTINTTFAMKATVPVIKSIEYPMLEIGGVPAFNPASPRDPRQGTLNFNTETGEVLGETIPEKPETT
ncbi:MAG: hypothetical protein IT442_04970 [Phycisphaeraceae bacterium]|nr:hypothetical protein [Phycisphaeraceae bacterium]